MKRIIEIPDKVVEAIQNGEDYRYDIHTAIAQSTPYNPTGDCISREALKEVISKVVAEEKKEDERWAAGLRYALTLIDNALTVEINEQTIKDAYDQGYADGWKERYGEPDGRPKGEWIITEELKGAGGIVYRTRKCNKCGWEHGFLMPRNFCPNCGADMRKGGNE